MAYRSRRLHWKAKGINTRKKQGEEANSIARRGQGGDFVPFRLPLAGSRDSVPCGVWGNAPTVLRALNSKEKINKGAGSEASLPVTLRSRRSAPQAALPTTCTLSRQMGATELLDFRFCLLSPNILFKLQNHPSPKTDQHGITPCWSVLYPAYFSGASGVVGVGGTGALP